MSESKFEDGQCDMCDYEGKVWHYNFSGRDEEKCDICFHVITGRSGHDEATKRDIVQLARYVMEKLGVKV